MNIKDAIRISLNLEKESMEFFKEAMEKISKKSGKDIFKRLSLDEKRHIEILFNRYKDYEDLGDIESFINSESFRDSDIIKSIRSLVNKEITDRKAIEIATELEKKGYNMYNDAARESKDEEIKKMFERLKNDEKAHYDILDAEYCSITGIPQSFELGTYVRE